MCNSIDPGYDIDSIDCSMRWVSRNRGCLVTYGVILLLSISTGSYPVSRVMGAEENLISNPGFEMGLRNMPVSWSLALGASGNSFSWELEDVHSGSRALKMVSVNPPVIGRSMGVFSSPFKAPSHSRVEVSLWMKAKDVQNHGDYGWFKLRFTLTAYDASGDRIHYEDILSEEGSFSWKKIQGGMIMPEGTDTVDLAIKLTTATGTVWIDDVEARVAEVVPTVDLSEINDPVIVPEPWKAIVGVEKYDFNTVAVQNESKDDRVQQAVMSCLMRAGAKQDDKGKNSVRMVLGSRANPLLSRQLSLIFPSIFWSIWGNKVTFYT